MLGASISDLRATCMTTPLPTPLKHEYLDQLSAQVGERSLTRDDLTQASQALTKKLGVSVSVTDVETALAHALERSPSGQSSTPVKEKEGTRRSWSYAELEALYPAGVALWKRRAAPWGVLVLTGAIGFTLLQAMMLGVRLFVDTPSAGASEILVRLLALLGTMGLFKLARSLLRLTASSDEVFVERLKAVDTESLIRWYQSRRCSSFEVLYGVICDRGIHLRL